MLIHFWFWSITFVTAVSRLFLLVLFTLMLFEIIFPQFFASFPLIFYFFYYPLFCYTSNYSLLLLLQLNFTYFPFFIHKLIFTCTSLVYFLNLVILMHKTQKIELHFFAANFVYDSHIYTLVIDNRIFLEEISKKNRL